MGNCPTAPLFHRGGAEENPTLDSCFDLQCLSGADGTLVIRPYVWQTPCFARSSSTRCACALIIYLAKKLLRSIRLAYETAHRPGSRPAAVPCGTRSLTGRGANAHATSRTESIPSRAPGIWKSVKSNRTSRPLWRTFSAPAAFVASTTANACSAKSPAACSRRAAHRSSIRDETGTSGVTRNRSARLRTTGRASLAGRPGVSMRSPGNTTTTHI